MIIELTTQIGFAFLSFLLGGFLMHLLKKRKIKKLKEELTAYQRSVDGLWKANEQKLKKEKRHKENLREDVIISQADRLLTYKSSDSEKPIPRSSRVR